VCAIDPVPWRLEVAKQLGADTVCAPEESAAGGAFDVVIEAAGTQSAVTLAGSLARPHGRVILVGFHLSDGGVRQVNMMQWNWQALDVINGHVRRDDEKLRAMQAGVDLLAAGRLVTKPLITSYALADIESAFQDLSSRKEGLLKAVLAPTP
jgi:threonine dehydrogenase-like Zn-dependent dehydrogenase